MTTELVVRHSGVKKLTIEQCSFHDIHSIEYKQARQCIGFDLWTSMLAAMADYSGAVTWATGTSYPSDTVVNYKGLFYLAIEDTPQNAAPPNPAYWELAPVFDAENSCAEKYEEFFCDFLCPYLANTILLRRLPYMDEVEYMDRKVKKSDPDSFRILVGSVSTSRAEAWGNILYYMGLGANKDLQVEGGCFHGWIGVQDDDCQYKSIKSPKHLKYGVHRFG